MHGNTLPGLCTSSDCYASAFVNQKSFNAPGQSRLMTSQPFFPTYDIAQHLELRCVLLNVAGGKA